MPGKFLGLGRQIDSQDNQASVSRFASQTETQDSRPYAPTGSPAGIGQKHNLILHAGSVACGAVEVAVIRCGAGLQLSPSIGRARGQAQDWTE